MAKSVAYLMLVLMATLLGSTLSTLTIFTCWHLLSTSQCLQCLYREGTPTCGSCLHKIVSPTGLVIGRTYFWTKFFGIDSITSSEAAILYTVTAPFSLWGSLYLSGSAASTNAVHLFCTIHKSKWVYSYIQYIFKCIVTWTDNHDESKHKQITKMTCLCSQNEFYMFKAILICCWDFHNASLAV